MHRNSGVSAWSRTTKLSSEQGVKRAHPRASYNRVVDEAQLLPGRVIAGRYRVVRLIGQGGMGQVYEAIQSQLGRSVALKIMRQRSSDQQGARQRFEREARVAATLRHPGIVAIHDFGEDEGRLFLAMELLHGSTLRRRLSRAILPVDRAVEIALRVAEVLVETHRIGLIHRDLKPENIFLEAGRDGSEPHRVVVADFGLAFIDEASSRQSEVDGSQDQGVGRLTREGIVSGTPAYISPEQALGRVIGSQTDIYSLGCILFESLCGRPPFEDESELAVLNLHLFGNLPAISQTRPRESGRVPRNLEVLIERMLSKRPEERPGAERVREGLESVLRHLGQPERGRGDRLLQQREVRMIDAPSAHASSPTIRKRVEEQEADGRASRALLVLGPIDEELSRGLQANGWFITVRQTLVPEQTEAEAIFAPGVSPHDAEELVRSGLPVVTDTVASDMQRISAMLEAGIHEVVPLPVRPEELCKRLWRAARRARRARRRPR